MREVISVEEVHHVAALARLALGEDEARQLAGELSAVLQYAAAVRALPTDDVPPTSHPLPLKNVLRADVVTASLSSAAVLAGAPEVEDGCFWVPRILGGTP